MKLSRESQATSSEAASSQEKRDPFASSVFHLAQLHEFGERTVLRFWPLPTLMPAQLPFVVREVSDWLIECSRGSHDSPATLPAFRGRRIPTDLSTWMYLWQKY